MVLYIGMLALGAVIGIIILVIIIILILLTTSIVREKRYQKYKSKNIKSKYLIHGRWKKKIIKEQVIKLLPKSVKIINLEHQRVLNPRQSFDGIPRFIYEQMHRECDQLRSNNKSPYLCTIDKDSSVSAISLRNIIAKAKHQGDFDQLRKAVKKFIEQ